MRLWSRVLHSPQFQVHPWWTAFPGHRMLVLSSQRSDFSSIPSGGIARPVFWSILRAKVEGPGHMAPDPPNRYWFQKVDLEQKMMEASRTWKIAVQIPDIVRTTSRPRGTPILLWTQVSAGCCRPPTGLHQANRRGQELPSFYAGAEFESFQVSSQARARAALAKTP